MQAAAKLGITITISQVGNEAPDTGTAAISATERTNEWKPSFSVDEDGLLHQLRATLVQALDSCMRNSLHLPLRLLVLHFIIQVVSHCWTCQCNNSEVSCRCFFVCSKDNFWRSSAILATELSDTYFTRVH